MKKQIAKRAAAFLCACAITTTFLGSALGASASGTSSLSAASKNVTPNKITVKVQNADVRDVLSAIAVNMGYNIIYVADPQTVTLEMKDVKPDAAFEYLLHTLDLQYIPDGKTLIVGQRELLTSNFRTHLALSQFKLTYLSATVLADQIQQLNLPVTIIKVPSNDKMLWVQGFSVDIGKINELVGLLDIPANAASNPAGPAGGKSLTYITVGGGMTAYEFDRLLKTLGIDCGLCLSDDGSKLYLYATAEEMSAVNEVLAKVTADGSYSALSNANKSEILSVTNISKASAIAAIGKACPGLEVITVDNSSKAFLVMGSNDMIQSAKNLLAQLDVATMNTVKNTVNTYQLQNITAAEAVRRLASVSFDDGVEIYPSSYSEFSKSLYVYCNEFYWPQVQQLIAKIDTPDISMSGIPVFVSSAANVEALRMALINVRQIPADKLQTFGYGADTILYLVGADASEVAAVDGFVARLNSVSSSASTTDVSWTAYIAYCDANNVPAAERTPANYGLWVMAQLGTSGGGTVPQPTPPAPPAPAPAPFAPAAPTPAPTDSPATKLASAETALGTMISTYAPTAATTPEEVLAAAAEAVAAAGLTDVNVAANETRTVVYKLPTQTETGLIGLPLHLTCGTSFLNYQANVTLPLAAVPTV